MKHFIEINGVWIGSGGEGAAVKEVRRTASMGCGGELDPGGVSAAVLELTLFPGEETFLPGTRLRLYDSEKQLLGTFLIHAVQRKGGLLELTAYDFVSKLDVDVTDWLHGLSFPMPLSELAQGLAGHCGLTLRGNFPDYSVPAFTAIGLTGRQLMQWIAQACGCFCAADPEGALELRWLRDRGLDIGPSGDTFYYQGTLELSEYDCAPIDRLHIGLSDTDTGLSHPESGENTLSIRGNYLLTGDNGPLIRTLYDKLAGLSYTPCVLETNAALQPGDLFTVHGRTCVAMEVEYSGGRCRVSGTGSPNRSGSPAVGSRFDALNGRMLELQWQLQGVEVAMTEFQGTSKAVSKLSQDVDHVSAGVSALRQDQERSREELTALRLTSDALDLSISTVESDLHRSNETLQQMTERFRFDSDGLTISDSATGMSILLSQRQIRFSGTTVIRPNNLDTTNLTVGESLTVGDFVYIPRTNGNLSFRYVGGNQ